MSFFDKKAAKALVLKQVEKQKAKLNTQSASGSSSSSHQPHFPTSTHIPQKHAPPGYPSASTSHSTQAKKGWQQKAAQKLNDPVVKSKVEKATKKKAGKSILKVGGLLQAAFEE
ncbi:unnamed protein product [Agarophyton chilense]|eukprot:gb/GEZJ01000149.1/.p1 GENE.gb/GEZJ01000149.1/~~gb/GEZJ01000149.1/.p1  ORF type:complete len:114 (-),score=30.15 gb/GEZJ01000149.1/:949-1290(-)